MRVSWIAQAGVLVLFSFGTVHMLSLIPATPVSRTPEPADPDRGQRPPLRIGQPADPGLLAERRRYRSLADYLALKLDRPIELVTVRSEREILLDLAEERIDVAFLSPLTAVVAMRRNDLQLLVKPEFHAGGATDRAIIVVRAQSPVQTVDDLAGTSIAMLRTPTVGDLFLASELQRQGILDSARSPEVRWAQTTDALLRAITDGRAEAGGTTAERLSAFVRAHPQSRLRRLASSDPLPRRGLLMRADVADWLGARLQSIVLRMDGEQAGREALANFGVRRFLPCRANEYGAIERMFEELGDSSGPPVLSALPQTPAISAGAGD